MWTDSIPKKVYIQITNKHRKRFSTSLGTEEMEIKTTRRYHFISSRMPIIKKDRQHTSVGKDVEKLEPHMLPVGI